MKNHIKLLTIEQLQEFNKKYIFESIDGFVLVKNRNYRRTTYHDSNKSFTINSKIRKITFTVETIKLWEEISRSYKISLVEVQNVVSTLYMLYQPVTMDSVMNLLKEQSRKLLKTESKEKL